MNKTLLESYQANKRLIERNEKKIEDEQCKNVSVVKGKVEGSSKEHPYIMRHYTVQMYDPIETDTSNRRILKWQSEIKQAKKEMSEVEQFIDGIKDIRIKEVFTYRYIDGMKTTDIADKLGYTKGRISQIISKLVKD